MDSVKPQNSPVLKYVIIVHILHTRLLRKSKVNEHFQGHTKLRSRGTWSRQLGYRACTLNPPAPLWKKVNESLLRACPMLSPAAAQSHMTSHLDFLTIM